MKKILVASVIFLLGASAVPQQTKAVKKVDYMERDSSISKIRYRIELIKLNIE